MITATVVAMIPDGDTKFSAKSLPYQQKKTTKLNLKRQNLCPTYGFLSIVY